MFSHPSSQFINFSVSAIVISPPVVCIDMIYPVILSGHFLLSDWTLLQSPYKQCPHFVSLLWPASAPPPQFPKPCLFTCIVCILLLIAFLFWSTQSIRQKLGFLLDSFCVQPSTRAPVFCSILLHNGNMLNQKGEKAAWEERQSASELHPAHSKESSKATLVTLFLSELQPGLHTTRQKLITKVVIGTGTADCCVLSSEAIPTGVSLKMKSICWRLISLEQFSSSPWVLVTPVLCKQNVWGSREYSEHLSRWIDMSDSVWITFANSGALRSTSGPHGSLTELL